MDNPMIRAMARQRLKSVPYSVRKLTLFYVGATMLLNILLTGVNFLLNREISTAGGVDGLNIRTTLTVVQLVLMLVVTLVTPFWNLGYTGVAMRTARNRESEPGDLLDGFYMIFPALRLFLCLFAVMMIVCIGATQGATMLYSLTPMYENSMADLQALLESTAGMDGAVVMDEATAMEILKELWPVYLLAAMAAIGALVILFYRLRLAEFQLVDGETGAIRNLLTSNRKMKGKCMAFFRLDLSFWWYFLLQAVAVAVAYGDLLIPGDIAFWGFYLGSCALQVLIAALFMPRVATTYALAYDEVTKEQEKQTC